MTTRPIHNLVLVVPMEEQTMEDPEDLEEAQKDEEGKAHIKEDLTQTVPNSMTPEKNTLSEEDGERTPDEGGSFEKREKEQEETAKAHPPPRGNLKVPYHDIAEEMQDTGQALRRGRDRPRKIGVNTDGGCQEAISPGSGKGSLPDIRVGYCLGP